MMAKKDKKKKKEPVDTRIMISMNRRARHKYEVIDAMECGIVLTGSEVKSLRDGKVSIDEAYGRVRNNEVWLVDCDIPEYFHAANWNHESKRPRKLLLHRKEINKFARRAHEQGLTLTPLEIYFNERGVAKVVMGLCRGKKLHDKRQAKKNADVKRDLSRAMRVRGAE